MYPVKFPAVSLDAHSKMPWARSKCKIDFIKKIYLIIDNIKKGKKLSKVHSKCCPKINYDTFIFFLKEYVLDKSNDEMLNDRITMQIANSAAKLAKITAIKRALLEMEGEALTS